MKWCYFRTPLTSSHGQRLGIIYCMKLESKMVGCPLVSWCSYQIGLKVTGGACAQT